MDIILLHRVYQFTVYQKDQTSVNKLLTKSSITAVDRDHCEAATPSVAH